jgi:molybdate transport system regulatory protein
MPAIAPLKLRVQLICGADTAMGPGKADVLAAVDRTGSISAAGRELGMSYRRTWLLVDTMNRCWIEPLVDTMPGGGARKGAQLTACGRSILVAFRQLEGSLMEAAQTEELRAMERLLRAQPLEARHTSMGEGVADD